jgi:single-stranded DNA-binding protein
MADGMCVTGTGWAAGEPRQDKKGGRASFQLQVSNRREKVDGEWKEIAQYIWVYCWGDLADRVYDHVRKGSRMWVVGHLASYKKDVGKDYPETIFQIELIDWKFIGRDQNGGDRRDDRTRDDDRRDDDRGRGRRVDDRRDDRGRDDDRRSSRDDRDDDRGRSDDRRRDDRDRDRGRDREPERTRDEPRGATQRDLPLENGRGDEKGRDESRAKAPEKTPADAHDDDTDRPRGPRSQPKTPPVEDDIPF